MGEDVRRIASQSRPRPSTWAVSRPRPASWRNSRGARPESWRVSRQSFREWIEHWEFEHENRDQILELGHELEHVPDLTVDVTPPATSDGPADSIEKSKEDGDADDKRQSASDSTVKGKAKAVDIGKQQTRDAPYSVHSVGRRRLIVLAASLAGFFSPLSASIYYPALPVIAHNFHVSNSQINLTVTTYLIIQGIAPMITAGFSDTAGRRPAYAICFIVYLAANLGLALQNDYAALMVLRCLQSAGSSGAIALANGVVSDIVTPQERGSFIAFASLGSILGPTLSPVIGGLITQYLDWHWIFWFLLIFTGTFCVPFFLFFPETCRKVVGDGSIVPPPINRSLTDYLRKRKRVKSGTEANQPATKRQKMVIPNPLSTLQVFAVKQTAMILIPSGIAFGTFYAVLTGASNTFKVIYGFNQLKVSLMYIPLGVGGIASALSTGKLVDRNFRRHAEKLGITVTRNKRQDLSDFPLERARLEVGLPLFYLGTACLVIYGWILEKQYSVWGPIILMLVMSWTLAAFFQVMNVLLVDTYPGRGATVTAAVNLVRCELGAAAAAVISPMTDGVGEGWAYTIVAMIGFATTPLLLFTAVNGIRWRREAAEKEKIKKAGREAKIEAEKRAREEIETKKEAKQKAEEDVEIGDLEKQDRKDSQRPTSSKAT
uniref:MFS-type transporter phiD n=1 Tax=Fungal sp. (strain ATCC 74256) TaxID=1729595 RepID=PHID_FUNX7|nr:RecName: Full=MFS-type transporter phiD; AltName: Full=Phomoidride biosynthesis cluster protein D [fungal sp. ATCC 74256]BBG28501.1 putative transporter [fungal sp. ATCC 74256]